MGRRNKSNKRQLETSTSPNISNTTLSTNSSLTRSSNKKYKQNQNDIISPTLSPLSSTRNNNTMEHTNEVANESKTNTIKSLIKNPNPSLTDVLQGIGLILYELNDIKSSMNDVKEKTLKHEMEIEQLKQSNIVLNSEFNNLKGEINLLKQQKLDCDIILSGFEQKLDETLQITAVNNLCRLYDMKTSAIINHYSFETVPKHFPGKKRGFVVISFATKNDQIFFNSKRKLSGPTTIAQLTGKNLENDKLLHCSSRLTKENAEISRELNLLKSDGKINGIRFRNSCIQYQEVEGSRFISVNTIEQLNHLKN